MSSVRAVVRSQKIVVDSAKSSVSVINTGPPGPPGSPGVDGGMTGEIRMWAATTVPSAWLECNGAAVSRTTYASLYALIGTTWGVGDGSTTFNLPDLRGRAPVGAGTGSGLTARTLGVSAGAETVTLSAAQSGIRSHTHPVDPPSTAVSINDPGHNHTQNAHNHGRITDAVVVHPFSASGGSISAVPNSFSATDKLGPQTPNATATNVANTTGITASVDIGSFSSGAVADAAATTPVSLVQPIVAVKFIIKV